jgi:hypothetical protein
MRGLEITEAVVNVAEHTGNGTGTHNIAALILLSHPHKVRVLPRRVVGRDTCLINLRVLWKLSEELSELSSLVVIYRLHREYTWVLQYNV